MRDVHLLFLSLLQVVESCVEGVCKPDPRLYKLCLERLGVQPSASIFLDDLGQNLKAAARLGIHTVKVIIATRVVQHSPFIEACRVLTTVSVSMSPFTFVAVVVCHSLPARCLSLLVFH